ncbi:MAG TPA: hypothetical protein DDX20_08305 [Stenotrophomonas sp.]|nr:hypothetical protein [Stenotrophomonas sp.]
MRKHAIRVLAALLLYALVWLSQAMAAEPFVEALADTSVVEAEQRLRASGDAVEWVRRVRVNELALAADEITVNLYDVVLHLVRDPAVPFFETAEEVIYRPDGADGVHREVVRMSSVQWTGTMKSSYPEANPKPTHPQRMSIWLNASGARAGFRHGVWRYTLDGDQLVKRDTRRATFNERNDVRDRRPD